MFLGENFKSKRDRDDFLIALAVVAFFIWLLYFAGFSAFDKFRNNIEETGIVATVDTDGDGIIDAEDECPNTKGLKIYMGCKTKSAFDKDGDGVANSKDTCPEVIGAASNNGCPLDADGDGFADSVDKCPDVYGDLDGCPDLDTDKDGIPNSKDFCPNEAGTAENKGCPEGNDLAKLGTAATDKDGDGDGDGVIDSKDKCPEEKGTASTNGCPDSDKDGIADNVDKCPKKRGVAPDGCPKIADADGDGVEDSRDKCPNEKGKASASGCPDKDNDGVADKLDKCPVEKGSLAASGCPDRDNDGIADKDDKCPDVKGEKPDGCAKTEDPNKDSDGDGVIDRLDNCPKIKGVKENKGCPAVKLDAAEKQALEDAIKNVQFANSQAILTSNSQSKLNKVAEIMKKYASYKLSIEGHTSADGKDETNLRLSNERAKSCFDYLVSKGVKANRMKHKGYGETRLKDKANPNGPANRRVEFDLYE